MSELAKLLAQMFLVLRTFDSLNALGQLPTWRLNSTQILLLLLLSFLSKSVLLRRACLLSRCAVQYEYVHQRRLNQVTVLAKARNGREQTASCVRGAIHTYTNVHTVVEYYEHGTYGTPEVMYA